MKTRPNISVDAEIWTEIKNRGINASAICEEALKSFLEKGKPKSEDAQALNEALAVVAVRDEAQAIEKEAVEAEMKDFYAIAASKPDERRAAIRDAKAKVKEGTRDFWRQALDNFKKRVSPTPPLENGGETKP